MWRMNTSQDPAKDRLLLLRRQLLQRISEQRGGQISRVEMAARHDLRAMDDRAQAITQINEEFAMNEHETAELLAIDQALERVALGRYGQCLDCGAPMGQARLHAWPLALRCVECQTRVEAHR